MTEKRTEPVARQTEDLLAQRVEKLKEFLPEAFSEEKIDFDKLRRALGDAVDDLPERYSFTWAGKRDAIRLLQAPSRATLVPCPEESVNFGETKNLFIEGENLEVLKLLYKAYAGRVKMIYIDPPYNTGNDFIYSDDYSDPLGRYLELTEQVDEAGNLLSSNPETSGRYHSAWLSMMYPRLFVARQLLREDGVIFVSIDDNEVQNLRTVMDELFGEENFITTVIWQKVYAPKNTARHFSEDHDYVVLYARNADVWRPYLLPRTEEADARYHNPDDDPRGVWKSSDMTARNYYSKGIYEVTSPSGKTFRAGVGRYWRSSKEKFLELDADNRIWWGPDGDSTPALKRFLSEVQQGIVPQTLWPYEDVGHTQEAKKELLKYVPFEQTENVLNTVKPPRLLQRMLQIATDPGEGDIVLDFFAGSAPLGQAVLKQNREDDGTRQFVCVQFPEPLPKPEKGLATIADIAKTRLHHVIDELNASKSTLGFEEKDERKEDLGFRVFKLAESHYRNWAGVAQNDDGELARRMEEFTDPLLPGWKPENVVWEVAIKEGFSPTSRIEKLPDVDGNTVYLVTDADINQSFRICLDDKLDEAAVRTLKLDKEDLFVCRDIALTDDLAANLALQCRLKTI
ncbi:MAG: site-specific DNA-methyltransferase [Planctomycetes bacterium]|nr:site-specific DNA-methyltransferase [Planctomycetota bacterium]